MRRIVSLILLLGLLGLLCGCGGTGEGGAVSARPAAELTEASREIPPETEPALTDRFPEEAYHVYVPGVPVEEADAEALTEDFLDSGTLYDLLYDWQPGPEGGAVFRSALRYPRLPAFDNREDGAGVTFRDGWSLAIFDGVGSGLPLPADNLIVPIADPGVFGVVERELLPLGFVPGGDYDGTQHSLFLFVTDPGGATTEYLILRDGTVLRDREETAEEKLPEDVTALLFAFKYIFVYSGTKELACPGCMGWDCDFPETVDPNIGAIRVEVTPAGGAARLLTVAEGEAFLRLVSDPALSRDLPTFACRCRSNCGPGAHGAEVLRFGVCRLHSEAETPEERSTVRFTLYADGHLVQTLNQAMELGLHPCLADRLLVERCLVSETAFDVEAILALLGGG